MPNNELILNNDSKLDSLQAAVFYLKELVEQLITSQHKIEDWVNEKEAMKITGLSRGTLLKLRKDGRITSSTISGKQNFYRISDFKKLLDLNEQAR